MKTNEFIHGLKADLKPVRRPDTESTYLLKWGIGAGVAVLIWLLILPTRADMAEKFSDKRFLFTTLAWLGLTLSTALVVYRLRLPGLSTRFAKRVSWALLAILFIDVMYNFSFSGLHQELVGEMSLNRGRCGPLIVVMAISWASALFYWVKQGAPTRPGATGSWIAFSAGALAALAMQFVCDHENSMHIVIWHFLPTLLLATVGLAIGRRLLRW